jgi:hypothetical protein
MSQNRHLARAALQTAIRRILPTRALTATVSMRSRGLRRLRSLTTVTVIAAMVGIGITATTQIAEPTAANAATIANTCSTGGLNPTDSAGYCWFDFTGLNPTASTGTITQQFTETVGSGFTVSFTVTITQSSTGALPVWAPSVTPFWRIRQHGKEQPVGRRQTGDPEFPAFQSAKGIRQRQRNRDHHGERYQPQGPGR